MTTPGRVAMVSIVASALIAGVSLGWRGRAESQRVVDNARSITSGGDPEQGRALLAQYGCGSCHDIPGVPAAHGAVGPPLGGMSGRAYVAGLLPHTPENLMRWIEDPQAIDSLNVMPTLGVTRDVSRHMAAYLYTIGN